MEKQREYAKICVSMGVNLQKGQPLVLRSQIETAEFARLVMEEAYKLGASQVQLEWEDSKSGRISHLNNHDEFYEEFPMWKKSYLEHFGGLNAAFLSIHSADPEALKGVDVSRLVNLQKIANVELKDHVNKMMNNHYQWSVVSVPTSKWAKKVFPGMCCKDAKAKLWEAIYSVTRLHENNPVEAWKKHINELQSRVKKLNESNFKELVLRGKNGTNLRVGLVKNHIWAGGSSKTVNGVEFVANMPTEEVFTMPDANCVDGVVYSSKPLIYSGNIIDKFMLEFKDGKVVNYSAEEGEQILKNLLETDEGASRLGEIALVDYNSPISNSNILFYNTLFDENASCHLAFGRAYGHCLSGGSNLSPEEKSALGFNESAVHVDFMVGTEDLDIIGITQDGCEVNVFSNGNYCLGVN